MPVTVAGLTFRELFMVRKMVLAGLAIAVCAGLAGASLAQGPSGRLSKGVSGMFNRGGASSGGLLARLNRPLTPTMPGLPTASPLGLIAPRLSNAVLIFQKGGLATPAGRLGAIGVLSPRLSPVFGMVRMPPKTPQAFMKYGLTILSPRAAVLIGMLQGARTTAAKYR